MRHWLSGLGLALALSISGCASIPVASIVPLARLDLAVTRISALRVALRLPESLGTRPGGVTLDVVLKRSGAADRTEQFLLVAASDAADLAGLAQQRRAGMVLSAFQLTATDIARFEDLQRLLAEARQHGGASLGFGIGMHEFCIAGPALPAQLHASTYLMTPETNGWLTVTDGFDLKSDERIAAGLATLGPCQP